MIMHCCGGAAYLGMLTPSRTQSTCTVLLSGSLTGSWPAMSSGARIVCHSLGTTLNHALLTAMHCVQLCISP